MCYTLPAFLVSGLLASSREKSEPRTTPKSRLVGPVRVRRTRHAPAGSDRRSIATSARPPRPHRTSQSGRGGTRRAPPRRSGKARTRAGGFFQAVRGPRAPSPSCTRRGLRDEEKHSHSHTLLACVGDAIMAPCIPTTDGTGGGRAGRTPCRRTAGARSLLSVLGDRRRRLI